MSPVDVMEPVELDDHAQLAEHGYKQELDRRLGSFSSFAVGFSYISILTGMFQLFYFGYAFGGPAFFWTWPLVFVGQMMVALCFAEYASQYPIAGSAYMWSKQLASRGVSWMAGWVQLIASIVTIAAVALAWQIILPQIWDKFQFFGHDDPANIGATTTVDGAKNAVLLGVILIVFTTIVNCIGVRLMSRINNVGVISELTGATLLIIVLAFHFKRGPGVVFETLGNGAGRPLGYGSAFLIAALMSAYVMYGFDTAGSLAEETMEPRRRAPLAIVRALAAAGIAGAALILVALMAVGDINDPAIGVSGLPFIVKSVLGDTLGNLFLIDVMVAITVCCLAVHTATIRINFAMARDNQLPAGRWFAKVSKFSKTPLVPAIVVGGLAAGILVVNIGNQKIFTVVTSIAIIMFYLAYLLATAPMLYARLTGRWPREGHGSYFSLGSWGLPVNILAVVYGAGMAFNLALPRVEVYPTDHWYYQWGAYVFIGAVTALGLIYYLLVQRHKPLEILDEHKSAAAPAAVAALRA